MKYPQVYKFTNQ